MNSEANVTQTADRVLRSVVNDHVLVLTLNRPSKRNAFDKAMALALEAALDEFESSPDLRVAILTGAGGSFCAGQDLTAARTGDWAIAPRRGGFGILHVPPTKPVIAAVEGFALAGGLELALACDLIVASEDSVWGLPEVRWSLVAAGGGLGRLPQRIPYHLAMEIALTGVSQAAPAMKEHGLINRLTPSGGALEGALGLAAAVAAGGPLAVSASVQLMRHCFDWSESERWERQEPFIAPILDSDDLVEGLTAFAEHREPEWKAR